MLRAFPLLLAALPSSSLLSPVSHLPSLSRRATISPNSPRRNVVTAAYSFASGGGQLTKATLCKGTCMGKAGWNAVAGFLGITELGNYVAEQYATNPQAFQSVAIGFSLILCLTLVNSIGVTEDEKETFENKEAFFEWLTRPPEAYSSDEGFNLFLVVFHGYCLYDASRRGDFEGFSFFSFLPVLAVIVFLQIAAKLRADARGWVPPPRGKEGWKQYKEAPVAGRNNIFSKLKAADDK